MMLRALGSQSDAAVTTKEDLVLQKLTILLKGGYLLLKSIRQAQPARTIGEQSIHH